MSMNATPHRSPRFTGAHLAAIVIGFFAVVVAVNFTMATLASRTFSGAIVKNGYVANQDFDTRSAAGRRQAALGWKVVAEISGGRLVVKARDSAGKPIAADDVTVTLRHPVAADRSAALVLQPIAPGTYAARIGVSLGQWDALIRLNARGHDYRLNERLYYGG
jgi:nitrogen fixation protein FixH